MLLQESSLAGCQQLLPPAASACTNGGAPPRTRQVNAIACATACAHTTVNARTPGKPQRVGSQPNGCCTSAHAHTKGCPDFSGAQHHTTFFFFSFFLPKGKKENEKKEVREEEREEEDQVESWGVLACALAQACFLLANVSVWGRMDQSSLGNPRKLRRQLNPELWILAC